MAVHASWVHSGLVSVLAVVALAGLASAQFFSGISSSRGTFRIYDFVNDLDLNRDQIISGSELSAFANGLTPGANPVLRCQFVTKFVNSYGLPRDDANNLYDIMAKGDRYFTDSDWQREGDITASEFRKAFQSVVQQSAQVSRDWQRLLELTRQYWDQKTLMEARARGFDVFANAFPIQ